MSNHTITLIKYFIAGVTGFWGILVPTFPIAAVLFGFILWDCFAAWRLARRVRIKYPDRATGKFRSRAAQKVFNTFLVVYGSIVLISLAERVFLPMHDWHLANYAAFFFCMLQLWSVLENESSENGSTWAKVLQKVMINKAERHFDCDLSDLKDDDNK